MKHSRLWAAAVVVAACALAPTATGQTRSGPSANKVQVEASATRPDAAGNQVITVTVSIDKGWHIHANPVGNSRYAGNKTLLKVASKSKVNVLRIDYSAGKDFGEGADRIKGYEDKAAIGVAVRRPVGDINPLELDLQVYACDKHTCCPRGNIKITVP